MPRACGYRCGENDPGNVPSYEPPLKAGWGREATPGRKLELGLVGGKRERHKDSQRMWHVTRGRTRWMATPSIIRRFQ